MAEIRIIKNDRYKGNENKIRSDYIIVDCDNVIIKVYFDKRFKLVGKSDDYYEFNSKPKAIKYFYNKITKVKTHIKINDRYIFVGDKLAIEIESLTIRNGCYFVSKDKTNKVLNYKD